MEEVGGEVETEKERGRGGDFMHFKVDQWRCSSPK